ncbi:tRNA (N6-threonylcarbamoyladenosine(37)-N6)-methyltransferase TrmO [Psittacicella gerlachiana]|uniref:tRNA (N6-threonylcarbamoyladenosine(37)-N6)-methyltransferase TrmO n=1 Tax=Psittacicella gerlachiana TaxID=2028574 RepID=A0A3A1YH74_9GAMM|nr:tRNA (N6-threonylcarbamoyladenosine(37)-N6)-methyltransferase TrmO [Psittacicella gerlachiana]RIY36420.1 tRNA (N6-threonylcarbamoyladenosine(37)-N6)-methyltransferase TrmO [Psittacicella gerlachiana]
MFALKPIGKINSLLTDKFSMPRQGSLNNELICKVELLPPYNNPQAVAELQGFSHLWLIGVFHANVQEANAQRLMVRPPRLGGNQRVGVFASRSSFRPNNLSLSLVTLKEVKIDAQGKASLIIQGCDLIDQTPIVDIKPYLPFADAPQEQEVKTGYVQTPQVNVETKIQVKGEFPSFSLLPQVAGVVWDLQPRDLLPLSESTYACQEFFTAQEQQLWQEEFNYTPFSTLTQEQLAKLVYLSRILLKLIALNPKPAYKEQEVLHLGMKFAGLEVQWQEKTIKEQEKTSKEQENNSKGQNEERETSRLFNYHQPLREIRITYIGKEETVDD